MARICIDLPDTFLYQRDFRVPAELVNSAEHMGGEHMLAIAIETKGEFMKSLGYNGSLDVEGLGLIMADSGVVYFAESDLDDLLRIEVGLSNVASKSAEFIYRVTNVTKGCEAARVKFGILFFDYKTKKAEDIPASFLERIAASTKA